MAATLTGQRILNLNLPCCFLWLVLVNVMFLTHRKMLQFFQSQTKAPLGLVTLFIMMENDSVNEKAKGESTI